MPSVKAKKKRLAFPTSRDIKTRLKFGHKRKGISREIATKLRLLLTYFVKYVDTRTQAFFPLFFSYFERVCRSVFIAPTEKT